MVTLPLSNMQSTKKLFLHDYNISEHRDKKGFTPLILAATAGHEKVVQILLDHNADIEAQSERTKDTPLSLACSGGRFEVVEVSLTHIKFHFKFHFGSKCRIVGYV